MSIETFVEYLTLKKKYKKLKLKINLATFLSLFLLIGIFILIYIVGDWYTYYSEPNIDYSRLNESETGYAKYLINQIRPEYLNTSRQIIFTRNFSDLNQDDNYPRVITFGQNRKSIKKITIYLSKNEDLALDTLCHELLHNLITTKYEEYFVRDVAKYGVCLK